MRKVVSNADDPQVHGGSLSRRLFSYSRAPSINAPSHAATPGRVPTVPHQTRARSLPNNQLPPTPQTGGHHAAQHDDTVDVPPPRLCRARRGRQRCVSRAVCFSKLSRRITRLLTVTSFTAAFSLLSHLFLSHSLFPCLLLYISFTRTCTHALSCRPSSDSAAVRPRQRGCRLHAAVDSVPFVAVLANPVAVSERRESAVYVYESSVSTRHYIHTNHTYRTHAHSCKHTRTHNTKHTHSHDYAHRCKATERV
jgi:hypothetical protein